MADCLKCGGTGWKEVLVDGFRRFVVCDCRVRAPASRATDYGAQGAQAAKKPTFERAGEMLAKPEFRIQNPELRILDFLPHPERVEANDLRVARLIGGHRGKQNAIKLAEVIRLLGAGEWDERSVKAAVSRLFKYGGMRIGSSRGEPSGYYLISTREELEETRRHTGKHALAWIRRWKSCEPTPEELEQFYGQLRAEFNPQIPPITQSLGPSAPSAKSADTEAR